MKTSAFKKDFKLTSNYGWRTDPITGKKKFHNGVDFSMPENNELIVPPKFDNSKVRLAQADKYGGKYIQIERRSDGKGYYNLHVKTFKKKVGDIVHTGDLLALSGNTGLSTGPHTHIGVQKDADVWDSHEDPMPYITLENNNMKKGDRLLATSDMNIRDIPNGTDIGNIKKNAVCEIISGPRTGGDYSWYLCRFIDMAGWVADTDFNKKTTQDITYINSDKAPVVDCTALEQEVRELTQQVSDKINELKVMKSELEDVKQQLDGANTIIENRDNEILHLKELLENTDLDKLEQENTRLTEELRQKTLDYKAAVDDLNSFKKHPLFFILGLYNLILEKIGKKKETDLKTQDEVK